MNSRTAIFPTDRHALYQAHGYSAAIASGGLLFVSGQVGSRSDGSPEPDFAAQVRLAFANLEATLSAEVVASMMLSTRRPFTRTPKTSST